MDLHPVVIHLEKATERMALITAMEAKLGVPIRIHSASDGSASMQNPSFSKAHIQPRSTVTQGAIGCFESHVALIEEFARSGDEYRLILEDDTVFFKDLKYIRDLMAHADTCGAWDMLYIGYSSRHENKRIVSERLMRLGFVCGTYAMLLRRSAIPKLKKTLDEIRSGGRFYPADWVYSRAIESYNLIAFGTPTGNNICHYASGFSYVAEIYRNP
jgi:GR25 family glycosyltransferase involved in LPS biosynthesis